MNNNAQYCTIKYSKVIPQELNTVMSQEGLNKMKELAAKEREIYIRKHYENRHNLFLLPKKATEIAYSNARYTDFSDTEKAVLAANIALPDDKLDDIINNTDAFNMDEIKNYLNYVMYFAKRDNSKPLTHGEKVVKSFMDKFTIKLLNRFNNYIGNINIETIINKLNEKISFSTVKKVNNKR